MAHYSGFSGQIYFPRSSLHDKYFSASSHTSVCGWKGTANYLNITVDGTRAPPPSLHRDTLLNDQVNLIDPSTAQLKKKAASTFVSSKKKGHLRLQMH